MPYMEKLYPILIFALLQTAAAQEQSRINLSEMTAEEVNQLSEEDLENVSAEALFLKLGELEGANFPYLDMVRVMLYRSYYAFPDNPPLLEQIKAFQRDNDFEPTGQLTYGQFSLLGDQPNPQGKRLYLDAYYSVRILRSFALASGTWEIIGENHAYPLNYSSFRCLNPENFGDDEGVCTEEATYVDDSSSFAINIYDQAESEYRIVSWEEDQIVAVMTGDCRNNTLTINASTEEVSLVTTNSNSAGCTVEGTSSSVTIPPLSAPRVSVLRDTREVFNKYYEDRNEKIEQKWSKRFQEFMAEMQEKL